MSQHYVVVAMSGGVDSSVAAALLVQAGYRVEGLMLQLWSERTDNVANPNLNRCCTPDQLHDAEQVARYLNIPFRTMDVSHLFRQTVVENFIDCYTAGLTPNPCLICNQQIRFGFMLDWVKSMGADYIATGHYVRAHRSQGSYQLLVGLDATKDQSYVLHMLNQSHLSHSLFPIGEYTKPEIRILAQELGLPVAEKADSQDICFLADGDYRRFLRENAPETMRPGPILDPSGRYLGEHRGLPGYTIGQRKGIGVSAPDPLYVLGSIPAQNALIVGPKNAAGRRQLTVTETRWVAGRPPGDGGSFQARVKIRYQGRQLAALVTPEENGRTTVLFDKPLTDIAPGQAAVFYQDQVCLGGGTIAPMELES